MKKLLLSFLLTGVLPLSGCITKKNSENSIKQEIIEQLDGASASGKMN